MLTTRTVVLSTEEVGEAIRNFIRTKYHEKVDKDSFLTEWESNGDASSISFTFELSRNTVYKTSKE